MRTHDYVYAISTNNIWEAIGQAEDALSDLHEEIARTSENENELQMSLEILGVLARHREERLLHTDAAPSEATDDDEGDSPEIDE
jgi:hypothetical protein